MLCVCTHSDGLDELQQEELHSQRQALTSKWKKQAARQRRSVGGGGGGGGEEEWDVEQEVSVFLGSYKNAGMVWINGIPVIQ